MQYVAPPTCVGFLYLSSDFERILNLCWALSITDYWSLCGLEINCNVLWFASKIIFGRYFCDVSCISKTMHVELNCAFVIEAKCIYLRGKVIDSRVVELSNLRDIKRFESIIITIESCMNAHDNISDYDPDDMPFATTKLKFKKLSKNAKAPTWATEGSVSYDLYAAENCLIYCSLQVLFRLILLFSAPKMYIRELLFTPV